MEVKTTKIKVLSERTYTVQEIKCKCPHCGLEYKQTIRPDESIFKVKCCKCKKFFMALRE